MKYLSIDIEATGLKEKDYIIEFAMVPFDTSSKTIEHRLAKSYYIQCPCFDELLPDLDPWVINNNESLIKKAHLEGIKINQLKIEIEQYIDSPEVKDYFEHQKIVLFGKSMSAIDLPFLSRDLGWEWMRKNFSHRQLDFSSVCYNLIDLKMLPKGSESGSQIMKYLNMGEVAHTALEDSVNTALMYLKLIEKLQSSALD